MLPLDNSTASDACHAVSLAYRRHRDSQVLPTANRAFQKCNVPFNRRAPETPITLQRARAATDGRWCPLSAGCADTHQAEPEVRHARRMSQNWHVLDADSTVAALIAYSASYPGFRSGQWESWCLAHSGSVAPRAEIRLTSETGMPVCFISSL